MAFGQPRAHVWGSANSNWRLEQLRVRSETTQAGKGTQRFRRKWRHEEGNGFHTCGVVLRGHDTSGQSADLIVDKVEHFGFHADGSRRCHPAYSDGPVDGRAKRNMLR